jgi:hypothetical protein
VRVGLLLLLEAADVFIHCKFSKSALSIQETFRSSGVVRVLEFPRDLKTPEFVQSRK